MFQAETRELRVPIVDKEGNPQSLLGAVIRWEVYRRNTPVLTKTTADLTNPITLYNAAGATDGVLIPLVPDDTSGMARNVYTHECRAILAGTEEVLFEGEMTLKYSETKD